MKRQEVVITDNCVNTKERELFHPMMKAFFLWCWVFKLKLANFVATSSQWKSWYTARILCFNKSFQRNCTISTGTSWDS